MATFLKYFTVYALSGLKFIFGPTLGLAYELPLIVTILLTSLGMMTTVYLFTYFGHPIRRFAARFARGNKKIFTKRNRRFVKIWNKYGLIGASLLTPLLLTPPGGALLVNIFGSHKRTIIKWMWISAIGWSTIITLFLKYAFVFVKDYF